jgi:hypothetical protein
MASSSAGAQASDQALANQANQSTAYAKQAHDLLFGSGTTGSTGGTLSNFLDPNSLNVSAPTGAYGLQYKQAIGNIAKQSNQVQGSLARSYASRGFGNAPSGFQADQSRQAAEDATSQKGAAFTDLAGKSYQDALSNFWNANNIASGSAATNTNAAISADSAAANNYANLYGTASTPNPSVLGAALGGGLQAGGSVGSAALTGKPKSPCWIAEVIYGVDDSRTHLIRAWLVNEYEKTFIGSLMVAMYRKFGERIATIVERSVIFRTFFQPIFAAALRRAEEWEACQSSSFG